MNRFTHSNLKMKLTSVVWTYDTFENNFRLNNKITKYLKESFGSGFGEHFSFKYFLKNTLVTKIFPK